MKKVKSVFEACCDELLGNYRYPNPTHSLKIRYLSSNVAFSWWKHVPVLSFLLPVPIVPCIDKCIDSLGTLIIAPVNICIFGALPLTNYEFLQLSQINL
jgi:hypothetical protein